MDRFSEMKVFVVVATEGSMSSAANALGLSPSAVSKTITRLEERLNVRLFDRSTRNLRMTREGELYAERCGAILEDVERAEESLAQESLTARGVVRVNSSVPIAHYCLAPVLGELLEEHPDLSVRLSVSDQVVDLYEKNTDLAIRVGPLADSSMQARKLGDLQRVIVAAPSYLEKHGVPQRPSDLQEHECLGFSFTSDRLNRWRFASEGEVIVDGRVQTDCGDTLRHLALSGVGIARLGSFMVRDDIVAGRLQVVLEGQLSACLEPVHAVYLAKERMPLRVRAVVDHLAVRLRDRF